MDDSNGNIISLLQRLVDGQDKLREDINARLDQTNARLDQTNARLDHVIVFMGRHHTELDQRVAALEQEVFKKSG